MNYAQAYKSVSLSSASPVRILDDVFARILVDCQEAVDAIEKKDLGRRGKALGHAISLLSALSAALEHKRAPEVCANLSNLYQFARECLVTANTQLDTKNIHDAVGLITQLRETFVQASIQAG